MASAPRDDPHRGVSPGRSGSIARVGEPQSSRSGEGGSFEHDLEQAIAVLRARMDEEFRIAERIDAKQRQAFALSAALFAVAQTVAFGGFAQGNLHSSQRAVIGVLALVAGLTLVIVMHRLRNAEELRHEEDVRPEAVVEWCNEADRSGYVSEKLVSELSAITRRRSDSNQDRAKHYDAVADAVRWSLIATAVELLVAVTLRI